MSMELTTLPNGLRIVSDHVPSVDSIAIGVWVDCGSRHEDLKHNGISHMVEHMMFKGTPKRSAVEIVEQIENVGGHINAYTSREVTAYHLHLLKDDLPLAVDILSDIIQRPTMPEGEIDRERGVILQEIGMTNDTPDDLVFDLFQETTFPGQALGAPILGRPDIIRTMTRTNLMDYVKKYYTPAGLVISAAGNMDHETLISLVSGSFSDLPENAPSRISSACYKGGDCRTEKTLEQSHIILGFEGLPRHDPDFYAAVALSTILGGGMSSRLFQEIREKRGLVYNIFSFHHTFQDSGLFAIYAGTGPDDLTELIPVLCGEIGNMLEDVPEEELTRAKAQMRADILMGRESMLRRANAQAKRLIHFGDALDIEKKIEKINALSPQDIRRVAKRIFKTAPTLTALGPLGKLESYDQIKERLAA